MLLSTYQKTSGHTSVVDNLSINLVKQGYDITIGALKFEKEPPKDIKKIKLSYTNVSSYFQNYDIIHNHQTKMNYYALFSPKPFVFQYHGASTKSQRINLQISLRLCKKHIQRIILVSKSSILQLPKFMRSEEILTIYNGIDTKFYSLKKDTHKEKHDPQLLFTGNLFKYKNVQLLIQVIGKLKEIFPKIHLQVVGDGEFKINLEQFVKENDLEENVSFLGRIDNDELRKKYQIADIYVSASTFETFGMPLLEAMACGTPVAVSDIPAHVELVSESGAGMYFSNNIDEAQKIISQIYQNRIELGIKGRKFAEKLDWEYIAKEYGKLYDQFV